MDRNERRLMSRQELLELDYERLTQELGNIGDWVLEIGDELRTLSPAVERHNSLKAELHIVNAYKSALQSIVRALRDAI